MTTNFESYNLVAADTFGEGIHGPIEADLKFGGDWDAHVNPLGSPPGLYVRDDLQTLGFVVNRIDATAWAFAYARIRGVQNSTTAMGKVTFQISNCKSQGSFTYPTASV